MQYQYITKNEFYLYNRLTDNQIYKYNKLVNLINKENDHNKKIRIHNLMILIYKQTIRGNND